ncbi:MAG: MFS transporter [Anaerolineae bacterium]|jgi:MFS family permease|nr:MFS transporter [Anaerolineae bacterium]MBT3714046.1 MFS transporter [Anaerolineae bacterium]MBT4311219.1 MFS transporter [Anaerolineae bacterium]MBT4459272.1 MFS transporter [Anaerolineae bacterium]MBT4841302.1 MFS transporter [Anaerolineae bacterium]
MIKNQIERWKTIYNEYPKTFWVLIAVSFIDQLGGALLFPFFALYITAKFNVGMVEVGILFALFSLSNFVGSILGGALTDRLGRKQVVIFSLVATAISSVFMGLASELEVFYIIAVLSGLFSVGGPARQAMVADILPEKRRAQGFGILRVSHNLSVAIGPAIGGLLLGITSYLSLFIIDALASTIVAVLFYFFIAETKPEADETEEEESVSQSFGGYIVVMRDVLFMLFIGVCILMGLVYVNMNASLGVYLRDEFAVPEAGYGMLLSMNALMVVLFQFAITRRIENRPPLLVMAAGMLLYTIGFGMYGFVSTTIMFILAMIILTIGEMLIAPVSQALVATFSPEKMRGRYMAVFGISWMVPFAVGPYLAGLIMDNMDSRILWYIVALVGMIATFGFIGLHFKMKENEPATDIKVPIGTV